MAKVKGLCPSCEQEVEFHTDGVGGGHDYRCGNCFHGLSAKEVEGLKAMQAELQAHEDQRKKILHKYSKGG